MPIFVCNTTCQFYDPHGRIRLAEAGVTFEFPADFEPPGHFERLDEPGRLINFLTASEDELTLADWSYDEANSEMQRLFHKELKPADKLGVVAQILDIRYRSTLVGGGNIPPVGHTGSEMAAALTGAPAAPQAETTGTPAASQAETAGTPAAPAASKAGAKA